MEIIKGNIEAKIDGLPKFDCVVTSPPYYQQRRYTDKVSELGWESTPTEYVNRLGSILLRIAERLPDTGTMFVNLGDKYSGGEALAIPWRVAIHLADAGLVLKNEIIWHKRRIMPQSAKNRFTYAHEHVFFFTKKTAGYTFNAEAVMEDSLWGSNGHNDRRTNKGPHRYAELRESKGQGHTAPVVIHDKRLCRSVWEFSTSNSRKREHAATFSERIPERCILAGSNPGDTVLDPFSGSGTTGRVAERLGREYIGVDIKHTK